MNLPQKVQLTHGALGVPKGRSVVGGDDDGPVGPAAGHPEAGAQARGGVDEDIVIQGSGGIQHAADSLLRQGRGEGHGRGEQGQTRQIGVVHRRADQRAASLRHIGEVHQGPVAEAQGDVQIPQADVHVDAQHAVPQAGQTAGHTPGNGGFSGAALPGGDDDCGSHVCADLPSHHFKCITNPTHVNGFMRNFEKWSRKSR